MVFGLVFLALPVSAEPLPSLSEVTASATALTQIRPGEILVVTASESYICVIDTNPSYAQQLINGVEPSPGFLPKSLCYPANNVMNLGAN